MKGKTKTQKGITLIALIITIVVLLILAAVAITSITNDGVLSYAENAATQYNQAVKKEQDILQGYIDYLNKHSSENGSSMENFRMVEDIKNEIQESNIKVKDEYGNLIVVPAGFKIRVDADEGIKGDEKTTATRVTEGIVIEDEAGNQFVWVPVGKIYTNVEQTESKTITLGRYNYVYYKDYESGEEVDEFNDYILDEKGVYTPTQRAEDYTIKTIVGSNYYEGQNYTEDILDNHLNYENAIARNLGDFVCSSMQNRGYYIGRFEAGKENDKVVCKSRQTIYGEITQPDSSTECKNMYNNGIDGYKEGIFSSDLVNSYAWDTAIIFIQTFGEENARDYYKQNNSMSFEISGGNGDEFCNINDMSGNAAEWITETCDYKGGISAPCVVRGWKKTADRIMGDITNKERGCFFSSNYIFGTVKK